MEGEDGEVLGCSQKVGTEEGVNTTGIFTIQFGCSRPTNQIAVYNRLNWLQCPQLKGHFGPILLEGVRRILPINSTGSVSLPRVPVVPAS